MYASADHTIFMNNQLATNLYIIASLRNDKNIYTHKFVKKMYSKTLLLLVIDLVTICTYVEQIGRIYI